MGDLASLVSVITMSLLLKIIDILYNCDNENFTKSKTITSEESVKQNNAGKHTGNYADNVSPS